MESRPMHPARGEWSDPSDFFNRTRLVPGLRRKIRFMGIFSFFQKRPASSAENQRAVQDFLAELRTIAPPADRGSYAFKKPDGRSRGFVQFIIDSPSSLTIHRLWTLEPGVGDGSAMLAALCELADRHGVELRLKGVP